MYDFHYNYIKDRYSKKTVLIFTDTNSLVDDIETIDEYEDF